ncbi:MAG: PrpF family protein [Rhodospirillaceae bacterium]|nr:PrpF family protein [Rhodospirillaceae bacterium]
MSLCDLPALFMRGGTSKAIVVQVRDLPEERAAWDAIFLAALGSPDPSGRQLDGMGGGISSLSKVCVVGPPSRPDADVDYTFAQVAIGDATVDYGGNCGNMSAAMGPAAFELGLLERPEDGEAVVRVHNTNTGKVIRARFPVVGGLLDPDGTLAIDGVAGTAAPIRLEFLDPGGAKTGTLLPTGNAVDTLSLPDGREVTASLVDAANPCVFVAAADLGKTATEHPDAMDADTGFMATMEAIRRAGSVAMGITADLTAAARMPSVPKVAIVAAPTDAVTLSGRTVRACEASVITRMLSVGQPHRAVPITGAICLAVATRVPGSIPNRFCAVGQGPLTISHPSGTILVDAEVVEAGGSVRAVSGTVYRTARKLFSGTVHYRHTGP